jgi:hypothetical protein
MSGSVPDNDRVLSFKILNLFIKKTMVRGESRQKNQLRSILLRGCIHPVVDLAAWRCISAFDHRIIPSNPQIPIL